MTNSRPPASFVVFAGVALNKWIELNVDLIPIEKSAELYWLPPLDTLFGHCWELLYPPFIELNATNNSFVAGPN